MPTNANAPEVHQRFFEFAQFPRVIGAIDGTHISKCNPGGAYAQHYINRKGFYSLNIQVCCDATSLIQSVVARWPGSTHDARIFHESNLKQRFEDGRIPGILLGDNGYPCLHYLLTPLLNPRTQAELHYNRAHKATRNIIERTFGILKRRFPCLHFPLRTSMQNSYAIIIAVCVLHNIATMQREQDFIGELPGEEEVNQQDIHDQPRGIAFRRNFIEMNF